MDLLDGLTEPFEHLDPAIVAGALREHWGIDAELERLDTERDDTFRAGDMLIKIAHPADDPVLIDMQSAALAHVAAVDPGIPVQRVVGPSVEIAGRVARVLTWLDGDLVEDHELPDEFYEDAGRMLGRLNEALAGFEHPGANRALAWDIPRLPDLRPHVTDPLHLEVLDRFAAETVPALAALPHQVIHNDGHPGNLLVDPSAPGRLAGILDFGDAVYSPRVSNLAVSLTYLWPDVDAFTRGYLAEVPLTEAELTQLPMLLAGRTVMRTVINRALHGDGDPELREFYADNDAKLRAIMEET